MARARWSQSSLSKSRARSSRTRLSQSHAVLVRVRVVPSLWRCKRVTVRGGCRAAVGRSSRRAPSVCGDVASGKLPAASQCYSSARRCTREGGGAAGWCEVSGLFRGDLFVLTSLYISFIHRYNRIYCPQYSSFRMYFGFLLRFL